MKTLVVVGGKGYMLMFGRGFGPAHATFCGRRSFRFSGGGALRTGQVGYSAALVEIATSILGASIDGRRGVGMGFGPKRMGGPEKGSLGRRSLARRCG